MKNYIVMPCLNEVGYVERAIASLVGPSANVPAGTTLIVVDNGSTDGTVELLADIEREYRGRVLLVHEPRRGFVPPRATGVNTAAAAAAKTGVSARDVLVLQADADTVYQPGYVAIMEDAARGRHGYILEGAAKYPPDFLRDHGDYVFAERLVDAGIESSEAADEDDVVIDDKISAYRLSDYIRWGGLVEEQDDRGDQIHAETTRMYIRARLAMGAAKHRVNPAGAASSRRRIVENPRYQFATLGFPREASWANAARAGLGKIEIDQFGKSVRAGLEPEAVFLRRAHLLALFRYFPAILLTAQEQAHRLLDEADVAAVMARVARMDPEQLANRPGAAIVALLRLIETDPDLFLADRPGSS